MFRQSAKYYDALYSWKDYAAESAQLHKLIQEAGFPDGASLLDVACGTGLHLAHLKQHYAVQGVDLDPALIAIAQERNPDVTFQVADMLTFKLDKQFDVITCLFSAIGYVVTVERLHQAIENMARHLKPRGVLIVEPWLTPENFESGNIFALNIDQPQLKITRMNVSRVEGCISILDFHYIVGTPDGIEYFRDYHELGLFTHEQYLEAFRQSKLDVRHDPTGLMGRGLYIGRYME